MSIGFIYFIREGDTGPVKIGFTERRVRQRAEELNTTGVPGKFVVEFYAEVNQPSVVEREIHFTLSSHHESKEFFRLSVNQAVEKVKRFIFEEKVLVHSFGGKSNHLYRLPNEKAEIAEQAKKAKLEQQRDIQVKNDVNYAVKFIMESSPKIEKALRLVMDNRPPIYRFFNILNKEPSEQGSEACDYMSKEEMLICLKIPQMVKIINENFETFTKTKNWFYIFDNCYVVKKNHGYFTRLNTIPQIHGAVKRIKEESLV